jgi:hypothetical protein
LNLDAIVKNMSSLETRIAALNKKWAQKIRFYC